MKKPSRIDDYFKNYSVGEKWELIANDSENISQVVVIPAFAEKELLFYTLASLAQNHPSSLEYSLILCVVNNKKDSPASVKNDNQQTIDLLHRLVKKSSISEYSSKQELNAALTKIADSKIRLGYIDASKEGYEITEKVGGVGMARKIGMDMALRLLQKSPRSRRQIISLDADTLVQPDYLAVISNFFMLKIKTAVLAFEHQEPRTEEGQAAIYCYEMFLRYWVLGLKYAKSPYAFHSIGSTIVCSTDAYLDVRGMNKREAGEDFYFLNKLAKIGKVSQIKETCVYPSARSSIRVPFGTGKRIKRFLEGTEEEYVLYHPLIFQILADWLQIMGKPFCRDEKEILINAGNIHPALALFLNNNNFCDVWSRICHNANDDKTLLTQFHGWFDGFKTLKLINFFSREVYPPIPSILALKKILQMSNLEEIRSDSADSIPDLKEQKEIVRYLRELT